MPERRELLFQLEYLLRLVLEADLLGQLAQTPEQVNPKLKCILARQRIIIYVE